MTPAEARAGRPRVLITRKAGSWPRLARELIERGVSPEFVATIRIVPPRDPEASRRAVAALDRYAWIVITSANGARALAERCRETARPIAVLPRIAAVGEATARAAEAEGFAVDLVGASASGSSLAAAILRRAKPGDRALWVRPEIAASDLDRALEEGGGVAVDDVAFYATVAAEGARAAAEDVARGRYRAVVITSPSSVGALVEAASDAAATRSGLERAARIAIGPTTAAAMEGAGLPPHRVASHPREDEIAVLVIALLGV